MSPVVYGLESEGRAKYGNEERMTDVKTAPKKIPPNTPGTVLFGEVMSKKDRRGLNRKCALESGKRCLNVLPVKRLAVSKFQTTKEKNTA